MPAKALEVGALAKSGRRRRFFGKWVLMKGKGISRNTNIEKHCVLVNYTGTYEVVRNEIVGDDFRINDEYSGIFMN